MSDKDIQQEKVVTRYDRKMQRRKEAKEKEQRQKKITTAVTVVVAIALVAWIASFPIRTYLATHETYIIVNGEEITKAEFDYYYSNVVNQFSSFIAYLDEDFLEESTVNNIKQVKALKAEADTQGFTFDASEEIDAFKDTLKESAKTAGVSTSRYLKQAYGQYASLNRISGYLEESARADAYYDELTKKFEPSEEEIQAYYEEHSAEYELVDYYVSTFPAMISDASSDEEIDAALSEAYEVALAAEPEITYNGDEQKNVKQDSIPSVIAAWLFDESRKEGDTTVIEDDSDYTYYTLGFVQRHRDETPRANVRVIMTQDMDGQAILEEWGAGAATEESFAELANKYSADGGEVADGGLYEGVTKNSISSDMAEWIFASGRKAGDTGYVTTEEGYTYVMYYAAQLDPEWKQDIKDTLIDKARDEYVKNLVKNVVVEDPKGNLYYLNADDEEEDVSDGDVSDNDIDDVDDADDVDDVEDADGIEDAEDNVSDGDLLED